MGNDIKAAALIRNIVELEPKVFSSAFSSCENICIFAQKQPDEIYTMSGRKILITIQALVEAGDTATITTIYPLLKTDSERDYLSKIATENVRSFEFNSLCSQYDGLIRRLKVAGAMEDAISAMYEGRPDADETFLGCTDIFFNTADTGNIVSVKDLCKTPIKDISKSIHYTPFGIGSIDSVLNGAYDGQFICFAGPPGAGKSTAALQAAKYQSTREPVLFFSLEMSKDELYVKMISNECRIDSRRIESGKLDEDELAEAGHARNQIDKRCNLYLHCGSLTESKFFSIVRKMVYQKGVKRVYLDYAQLVKGMTGSNKNEELENFSGRCKSTAHDLGISIIAMSQLTKAFLTEDRAPTLGDLRGSLAFGQDGDTVVFFYNAKIKSEKLTGTEPACVVAKQRKGEVGRVKGFKYNKKHHLMY